MPRFTIAALAAALPLVLAQQIGKTTEAHPKLTTQKCSASGGCSTLQTSVVLDSTLHAIQTANGTNCLLNGGLNPAICPTQEKCAKNCYIEGTNYDQNGVDTHGNSMTLHMYKNVSGEINDPVSPRVYLLDPTGQNYETLYLLNQELSFDVDVSNLPCGMNGAFYLTAMPSDGGRNAKNPAGAAYGTGYCDAQCPKSTFIAGVANEKDLGACCAEFDIWEANVAATQMTPHPCTKQGLYKCNGTDCENVQFGGVCDEWGCGYNPYTIQGPDYYGPGKNYSVNTNKPFTVVTQFLTKNNASTGTLNEIRRLYIQNGKVIENAKETFEGATLDSTTVDYCNATASTFEDAGGFKQMSKNLAGGMVLIASIWNDQGGNMTWLDTGKAGPCDAYASNPSVIVKEDPTTSVTFSNIRWGDIGSTYKN